MAVYGDGLWDISPIMPAIGHPIRDLLSAGVLAIGGGVLNIWSDYRLWRLRRDNRDKYVIPRGGVFNLVSCPNLLGEIIEWIGFALLSWSLPGLAFALWTIANLVPRALWRHAWYHETFEDYPPQRRAILPGLI